MNAIQVAVVDNYLDQHLIMNDRLRYLAGISLMEILIFLLSIRCEFSLAITLRVMMG